MAPTTIRPPSKSSRTAPAARAVTGGKMIDPVRILRQNVWMIIGACVIGMFLGGVAYAIALLFYPSYDGKVVFELRPALQTADAVVSSDYRTADTVTRLARTETSRVFSEKVLTEALEDRDVKRTAWAQQFMEEGGSFNLNNALLDLMDELSAYHVRDTNTFEIYWYGSVASDVPVILTAVQDLSLIHI